MKSPEINVDKTNPKHDSIAWATEYNFRCQHFFDNIDFTDNRILYTPLFQPKLDAYFNKILLQIPDTIVKYSMKYIDASRPDKQMFQYVSQYLLNNSIQSKIMGMDKVVLNIAEKVYLNGDAYWAQSDTSFMAKLKEEVIFTRYNQIGDKAQELILKDTTNNYVSLYQIDADYIILVFWDPTCGHCKKEIPELYTDVYQKLLDKNIEVVAVYNGSDKKEWLDFVNQHELAGWVHLWDPDHTSGLQYKYDVRETPRVFLLDKNKKIIAKKLDNKNLINLIEALLKEK
jgi:peroxiredoxin